MVMGALYRWRRDASRYAPSQRDHGYRDHNPRGTDEVTGNHNGSYHREKGRYEGDPGGDQADEGEVVVHGCIVPLG